MNTNKFRTKMCESRDKAFCERHGLDETQLDRERHTDLYQDYIEIYCGAYIAGYTNARKTPD